MTQDLGTAVERFDQLRARPHGLRGGRRAALPLRRALPHPRPAAPGPERGLPPPGLRHDPPARGQDEEPRGHGGGRRRPDGRDASAGRAPRPRPAPPRARRTPRGSTTRSSTTAPSSIGMAALKYFLLKFSPRKSFEYDPRASIDFLGQTGPYCLFNYARTRSLLRKAGGEPAFDAAAAARLGTDRRAGAGAPADAPSPRWWPGPPGRSTPPGWPSTSSTCARASPSSSPTRPTTPSPPARTRSCAGARLMLAAAVGHTLQAGLGLLGIEPLEEM